SPHPSRTWPARRRRRQRANHRSVRHFRAPPSLAGLYLPELPSSPLLTLCGQSDHEQSARREARRLRGLATSAEGEIGAFLVSGLNGCCAFMAAHCRQARGDVTEPSELSGSRFG